MRGITNRGFTLIELLVAISVIAIVSAVGLSSFSGAQKRARDVRRQSDLGQYRVAMENYASVNGGIYSNVSGDASLNTGIFLSTGVLANFLTGQPRDPKQNAAAGYDYYYRVDATGFNWVLHACMESSGATPTFYEVCNTAVNSKAGQTAVLCTGTKDTTCDVP